MAMDDTGLLSINQYTADGSQTQFELSFAGGYLNRDHIHVMVFSDATLSDGVTTPFTWVSDFQISITPAVASGKIIRIYRQTPYDRPQVDFSDGSIINEKTLDLNAEQAVFLAAELRDRYGLSYEIEGIGETVAAGIAASEAAIAAKESLEELQDDVNVILGPDGASNLGFDVDVTNSVSRSVAEKLRDVVSVKDFGAKGDGVTDDTVAIQNALDTYKPTDANFPVGVREVHIPAGTYIITAPIKVYSGMKLVGDGVGTVLKAGAGLTTQVIEIAGLGPASPLWTNRQSEIGCFKIIVTGTVWAIKSTARQYLESSIHDIHIDGAYGISLDPGDASWWTYTQSCVLSKITITGNNTPVERVLEMRGNRNYITHVNKEHNTGSVAGALIYCKTCDSNVFEDILLEGAGNANKYCWEFIDSSQKNIVRNYWQEHTGTGGGYAYKVDGKSELYLTGYQMVRTHGDCKIKASNKSWVWMEHLDTSSEINSWTEWLEVDADSFVTIQQVTSRNGSGLGPMGLNARVNRFVFKQVRDTPVAGFSQYAEPARGCGQNLFINGSFEAGEYKWVIPANWDTVSYDDSEEGTGKMLHASLSGTAGGVLYQNVVIPASLVGKPVTLRARVKCEGACAIVGRMANFTISPYQRVDPNTGWNDLHITFSPQTSGTLGFGLQMVGSTLDTGTCEVWIDDMTLAPGDAAILNSAKFGSIDLGGHTIAFDTAAPNKGTWKQGDRVFNHAPASGQATGWICTVAGTPGTWVAEGTLA